MNEIARIVSRMEPNAAAQALAQAARDVFPLLSDGEQREFIERMLGEPGEDKVGGLVHL